MVIYKTKDLYNKYVQDQAAEAFTVDAINREVYKKLVQGNPTGLYIPNLFIRIALTLLTLVAVTFSGLLIGLVFGTSGSDGAIALLVIYAIMNYVALELLVKAKNYYNAGLDNFLLLSSASLLTSAFMFGGYVGQQEVVTGVATLACLLLAFRFADAFMAALGYLCLFLFIFLVFIKLGAWAKAVAPFFMMLCSASGYLLIKKLRSKERLRFYRKICKTILLLSLITLYASTNYFVVKELSNEMFGMQLDLHEDIPFGWLFWILTFLVPIIYLLWGAYRKNLVLARTGLVLFAVSIFTFRYYYPVMLPEIAMLIAGILLIVVSYAIIKILKAPRYGFSFIKNKAREKETIDLKALIITQVAGKKTTAETAVRFGGGDFGGGGAGGGY